MKKFRLIKTYPGSPDLNTIVVDTNINTGAKDSYFSENWGKTMELQFEIGRQHDCENNPEYWEEVIEKDYVILELLSKTKYKYVLHPNGLYAFANEKGFATLEQVREHFPIINSVKRLSDGEIFTIGDKVQDSLTDELTNFKVQTITYFYPGDKIICQAESGTTMPLTTIRKVETPLFTTEDGVDIFEGDTIFGVNVDWKVFSHYIDLQNKVKSWGIKPTFSTKEKAEEYILLNKPCLTINDVRNCINQTEIDIDNEHELNYQLLQSVKEKLYENK